MRKSMEVAGLVAVLGVAVALLPGCKEAPKAEAPPPVAGAPGHPTAGSSGGQGAPNPHAAGGAPAAPEPVVLDDYAKAVQAYPITLARLRAYTAALKEIRAAGEKDPAMMAKLREPSPPAELPAGMAARLEGIGPVKGILAKHGLVGMDLILIPQAIRVSRLALTAVQEGRPAPEGTNLPALKLYQTDIATLEEIVAAYMAEQRVLAGR